MGFSFRRSVLALAGGISAALALASCSQSSTSGDGGRDASPGDSTAGDSPIAVPDAGDDAPLDATTADTSDTGAPETSAGEAGNSEAAVAYPAADFIFGFDQVAGSPVSPPWPLSDAQLTALRDDFGMNTMRIFVHPAFVGLPQMTWSGPEPIKYSAFPPSAYVFDRPGGPIDSLDEIIQKLLDFKIFPLLQPLVVDEYLQYVYKTDITFLDDAGVPDGGYAGIIPKDEMKAFSLAVASHVQQRFGAPFGVVWAELCGNTSNTEGATLRTAEKAAWTDIASTIRNAAPSTELFGPELCLSQLWFSTTPVNGCGVYDPVYYGPDWPRFDRLDNYASVFGEIAVSFYTLDQSVVTQDCPQTTRIRATTDTDIFIVRNHINGTKWLYSEVGWGGPTPDGTVPTLDDVHLNWASFLLGSDRSRGVLIWQAMDTPANLSGMWDMDGGAKASYADLKALSAVVRDNHEFLASEHSLINADGLPTDTGDFAETDPMVATRKLAGHVIVFSNGPTQVQFSQTNGHGLALAYSGAGTPSVTNSPTAVVVSGLVPNRVYAFSIQ